MTAVDEQSLTFLAVLVAAVVVGTAIGLWMMPLLAAFAHFTGFLP